MVIPLIHSIQSGIAEHLSLADDLAEDLVSVVAVGALVFI
jgi:hypothetical protein